MKHPLNKISKKNRNIISGILVAIASIYAVASYFDLPQSEINSMLLATALLVVGIIFSAIIAVLIFKGLSKLGKIFSASGDK